MVNNRSSFNWPLSAQFNNIHEALLAVADNPTQTQVRVFITQHAADAEKLYDMLIALRLDLPIYHFPHWETLPYDQYSPSPNIVSIRLHTLYRLRDLQQGIVVTSVDALISRLCPPDYLYQQGFLLAIGDTLPMDRLSKRLTQAGFQMVSQVIEKGQFSRRGALIDVFPPGAKFPIRIDFFDDEVESLRVFDVKTQLTAAKIERVEIIPSREIDLSDAGRICFRQHMRSWLGVEAESHSVYQAVSNGRLTGGMEYYLPLFFDQTVTLFDYLPQQALLSVQTGYADYWRDLMAGISRRHEQIQLLRGQSLPAPEQLYIDESTFLAVIKSRLIPVDSRASEYDLQPFAWAETTEKRWAQLEAMVESQAPVYVFCQGEGQYNAIQDKLSVRLDGVDFMAWDRQSPAIGIGVANATNSSNSADSANITDSANSVSGTGGAFVQSFVLQYHQEGGQEGGQNGGREKRQGSVDKNASTYPLGTATLLAAQDLLRRPTEPTAEEAPDLAAIINDLSQIEIGDPVVDIEHGVGRYLGLERVTIDDETNEYITLNYANDEKLFIPITELARVSRYTGVSADNAPLHRLDGKQWKKAKAKAKARIYDTAAELLGIYAERAQAKGQSISVIDSELAEFASGFDFAPTADQKAAFNAVYQDLQSEKPMDRIVCGDVGFGKTEVALRAAFAVANAGYQVAVIVPTTLLAEQHYQHFVDRFSAFPINIAGLSRFRSAKAQAEILAQVQSGQVDIVIGTHRLIQKDVAFAELRLVIIDEEHKFGVKQKEKLKALRTDVNILTMTATPIPRTLSMTLADLRDLSIIASPPPKRTPVHTIFSPYDESIIHEGVMRETSRGGQIYFLHNDINTMMRVEANLAALFPALSIRHAHGKMPERELAQIMQDFHNHRFDILLTTTIIESGIDNPNANTIFINRADRFGLAQLHQLRGRVGRSHHQAYAYLIVPDTALMSRDAQKRIAAFSTLNGLGVGFMLASQDMEIRGAGELLGDNQSGHVTEIGFSLYHEMLAQTIEAMKNNTVLDLDAVQSTIDVDLGLPALIPDDYIYDVHTRLLFYKRIASCQEVESFDTIRVELIDRFGLLPDATKTLFAVSEAKLLLRDSGVSKLNASDSQWVVVLADNHQLDNQKLIALLQSDPAKYQLKANNKLQISQEMPTIDERLAALKSWLAAVS
ncbi:transcription-repair coupling factor [Ostreibacterium oceani]|uniref:Transcription-repair-coupling factor n=1 Tax=Ostreibacterium oceani TaxID=2654998 RepID=A0A6N7F4Z8_9GAMM|nr:transcription-repair coupling factor [Ostreibacterium oceani]MPV86956.1 transcription-repair coupling factor [Ostreibacterium oceani]